MCRKEYEQICTRAEDIDVILEFPAEPELSQDGNHAGEASNGRETARQEIREILAGVLLESMEPPF